MEFKYAGRSQVLAGLGSARVGLATNVLREAVFFDGELGRPLVVRDALAALHAVVTSDLKYRPRDRASFEAWMAEQDRLFIESLGQKSKEARAKLEQLEARRAELDQHRRERRKDFEAARREWIAYAIEDALELSEVLDPVVTVHPDELSFEGFSKDQSSYARLAVAYDVFARVDAFECGTTNVDFSGRLATQLDRMRSYRQTRIEVASGGLTTSQAAKGIAPASIVREKRIPLPDGWLEGFLQVHGLTSMGLTRVSLAPIDVHSLLRFLAQHRAKTSPRALRFELSPGAPVKLVVEPWSWTLTSSPKHLFTGSKPASIRVWGRDRLKVLARLLPSAERVDVYLAGTGLPSVWVLDLGNEVTFTLALSGWTDNDWVEGEARFDLLTRRLDVDEPTLARVYAALQKEKKARADVLAKELGLGVELTRSALSILCQAGRAMYDLASGLHRHRDLLLDPFEAKRALTLAKARSTGQASTSDPRAKEAKALFDAGEIRIIARRPTSLGYKLSGNCRGPGNTRVRPQLGVDRDGAILEASCTCEAMTRHGMTKGPCEHVLALRLAHMERLASEDVKH
jgi:hypothetical protein